MEAERISSASKEYVRFPVFADTAGALANPSTDVVQMAFLTGSSALPAPTDWHAGTWDTNVIGGYVAQILVGTGGAVALTPNTYYCWLQLTDGSEVIVRQVGQLIVE